MKRAALAALFILAAQAWHCSAAEPVAVDVVNASRATRCAEEDNVYVQFLAPGISSFRISAEHPQYIASIRKDSTAPDFTACDMTGDPSYPFGPAQGEALRGQGDTVGGTHVRQLLASRRRGLSGRRAKGERTPPRAAHQARPAR